MQLKQSNVIFNQEQHTYSLNGVQLSGITGMLERQLFPKKYENVPQFVLERAAERGSMIHEACELVDELGVEHESQEAQNYIRLKQENILVHEASEYLVSDNEHFASCIDKVYRVDNDTFDLADIKTTYKLDTEYVSWQLSIYAYLFEMQNPGAIVRKAFAIWLRGEKAELVEVKLKPNKDVMELLACEINGTQYSNPYAKKEEFPLFEEMEDQIYSLMTKISELEQKKKDLQEALLLEMTKKDSYSWKGSKISITRKKDSVRKSFDKKAFEADHPDMVDKYMKESKVAGGLMIKMIEQ